MLYKIGEVEKILGITRVTTRFFEKKGIIKSERDNRNNYRYYKAKDINKLFVYKIYRKLGFNLEEATGLVSGNSIGSLKVNIRLQKEAVDVKKCELERIERRLKYLEETFEKIPEAYNNILTVMMPNIIFVKNQEKEIFIFNEDVTDNTRICFNSLEACLPMFKAKYGNSKEEISYGYGILLDINSEEYISEIGEKIDRLECLYSIIIRESETSIEDCIGKLVEEYLSANNIKLTGDIWGHIFHEEKKDNKIYWYFEVWIPYKKM